MNVTVDPTGRRVLVTNDDGIDGPGLRVLVATLVEHGYTPIVIAPDSDYSGAGTSIIGKGPSSINEGQRHVEYSKRVLPEAPDVEAYAVAAPPAMCALMSMRGAFGDRPNLVTSGINYGLNTGKAVNHSGTVAAALTAAGFGVPSLALSAEHSFDDPDGDLHYETAATVGMHVLSRLAGSDHLAVNLNVPRRPMDQLLGVRAAPLAQVTSYFSVVQERTDTLLKIGFETNGQEIPEHTDSALVKAGYATVTSLVAASALESHDLVEDVDLSARPVLGD